MFLPFRRNIFLSRKQTIFTEFPYLYTYFNKDPALATTTIRIGGVPEHFNLPWHLAMEDQAFRDEGIQLMWKDYYGGTGAMTRALREDEADICILLTEGIITDIIKGNPSKIISQYVTTPLIWGIHTSVKNELRAYIDIFDKKYAISRFGSGSYFMPIIDAHSQGKKIQEDQFVVINNLDNAITSLTNLETDVFYWEKFTTKPQVDRGILRRVGEFPTPWPCFMIAATDRILKKSPEAIVKMLRIIHRYCDRFMETESAIDQISLKYMLLPEDVEEWYHRTEWATNGWVNNKMFKNVIFNLKVAGIIEPETEIPSLVWKR